MLLNYETVVVGERCVLVPYRPEHVGRYHAWMQDPALLEATASEPLSREDEDAMQASWRDDCAKCTFIVLAKELLDPSVVRQFEELSSSNHGSTTTDTVRDNNDIGNDSAEVSTADARPQLSEDFIELTLPAMVGDVNLFLSLEESDDESTSNVDDNEEKGKSSERVFTQSELDIMVAEPAFRSKGIGREAASLMMLYGASHLSIRRFFCKISENNVASLRLFLDKLGFVQCAYAACFKEVEVEYTADSPKFLKEKLTSRSCPPLCFFRCSATHPTEEAS